MGRVFDHTPPEPLAPDARSVRPFDSWDMAQLDARSRGACIVFDSQYRFWSVPLELTLLEVHTQIFNRCLDDAPAPINPLTVRPPHSFGRPPQVA